MDKWFEFGGVRGIIGAIIGVLQAILLAGIAVPTLTPGVQSIVFGYNNIMANNTAPMYNIVSPALWLSMVFIVIILSFAVSGFIYWLGEKIVRLAELNVKGVTKAIACGIAGSLVIGIPLTALLYVAVVNSTINIPGSEYLTQTLATTLIISIPLSIVAEAGFAALTWWIYKQLGWKTPA